MLIEHFWVLWRKENDVLNMELLEAVTILDFFTLKEFGVS